MMISVEKIGGCTAGGVGGGTGAEKGGDGHSPSPRRVGKEEAYKMMLHQRRDAVSGHSGDEAILRTSTAKCGGGTKTNAMRLTADEHKAHKEENCPNNRLQRNASDEKCMQKNRGPKNGGPAKKWTSALRVVAAMTRFKNLPKRQHQQDIEYQQQYSQQTKQDECSRGSSFSNESTPGRNSAGGGLGGGGSSTEQDPDNIDPVYLALKQATEKYGTPAGSRRGSQNIVVMMAESLTPSPRDLSQTSLQDSGTYSGSEFCAASRHHAFATGGGSTPHLHGISAGKVSSVGICGNSESANNNNGNNSQPLSTGRRPKLSEKMKSLSLDCAEMPEPVQSGMIRQQYKSKPVRSARGRADTSVQQSFDKSASPIGRPQTGSQQLATVQPTKQRRLPPVPNAHLLPQHQVVVGQQQQQQDAKGTTNNSVGGNIMHIIIHEYSSADTRPDTGAGFGAGRSQL